MVLESSTDQPKHMRGLVFEGISIQIASKILIRNLTCEIPKGAFVGLVGANGSGKSLLLQTIRGLREQEEGRMSWQGAELERKKMHNQCAFAVQDPLAHFIGVTVEEDLNFALRSAQKHQKSHIQNLQLDMDRLIAQFGLEPLLHRSPSTLSGGEKRKLMLAGILAQGADIVLLDEPFSALDRPACRELLSLLLELSSEGLTIIMATHLLEGTLVHLSHLLLLDGENRSLCMSLADDVDRKSAYERLYRAGLYPPRLPWEHCSWIS